MTGGTDVDPELLATVPLLTGLGAADRARLAADAAVRSFAAGEWVFRRDDPGDSVFLVLSGRVEIVDAAGAVIRVLGASSAVGELALLTGAPRTASVRVRRDAELLEISADRFDQLLADAPELGVVLARYLARLLQQGPASAEQPPPRPRVVAIAGDAARVPLDRFAAAVVTTVAGMGERVARLDADPAALDAAERDHDLVVLVADLRDTAWVRFCSRQADRTVTLVGADERADRHCDLGGDLGGDPSGDVVVVADGAARGVPAWIAGLPLRGLHACDVRSLSAAAAALARRLAGRSVGLVLSGGGAPALAHLGVLDACAARGVAVERIGGVGTGALIGALAATGRPPAEVARICRTLLVDGPGPDRTLPLVALTRGRRTRSALEQVFGTVRIEDLPVEFFCVSTDLVRGEPVVHRRGRLADAVRCSSALPGVVPPIPAGGRLLVDGGLLEDLPVAAMAAEDGPVVAVDATATLRWPPHVPTAGPLRRVGAALRGWVAGVREPLPDVAEVLSRVVAVGGGVGRARADLVIRPEPDGTGPMEWARLDAVRERGRIAAEAAFDAHGPLVR
ncbi:patatin-like phospholipase family protein [Pseudonocardia sp.]|uniref:patatin-like phospholipase family protein n=1 Tax=Pseudonocardia sp. TaxID=60912 RepID=UPI003D0EB999